VGGRTGRARFRPSPGLTPHPNPGFDGEAWHNQLLVPPNAVRIEKDFDRNSLHDFREIPGSVFRRKQRKYCAGAGLEAVNFTRESMVGERVYADLDGLSRPNSTQLDLIEVSHHPDIGLRDRQPGLARVDTLTCLEGFLSHSPVGGCENSSV
jgi:hypothetical protein